MGLQLARLGGHRAPNAWNCSAHSRDVDKWAKHLACVQASVYETHGRVKAQSQQVPPKP